MQIKKSKGFTIVEVFVVLAIIAVLLVITIPTILKNQEKSRADTCQSQMEAIDQAKIKWLENNIRPRNIFMETWGSGRFTKLIVHKELPQTNGNIYVKFPNIKKELTLRELQKLTKTKLYSTCPCGKTYKIGSILTDVECPKHGRYKEP